MALTPIVGSPFQANYSGPFLTEKLSDLNYLIATPERRKASRFCHVNLLKPYYKHDGDGGDVRPVLAISSVVGTADGDGVPEPDESLLYGRLEKFRIAAGFA